MYDVLVMIPASKGPHPKLDNEIISRICSSGPSLKVTDASFALKAGLQGDNSEEKKLNSLLATAEIIFGFGSMLPSNLISRAPKLKWLQLMSAGGDRLKNTDIWQSNVVITGVSGIHAVPISEFVLGYMLAFAKELDRCFEMKQRHEWQRYTPGNLRLKTVGIVGLGHIGREVARLSKSFGMKVLATKRTVKATGKTRHVDLLLPPERLREMLSRSDYVVLTVPLTPETDHLIGEEELRSIKRGSYLINIARGALIDEGMLIRALNEKIIEGAALDVAAEEPLPKNSPLWEMSNVIISPHVSGNMEDYMERATEIFCDNLGRYLKGKRLRNVIDRERGY